MASKKDVKAASTPTPAPEEKKILTLDEIKAYFGGAEPYASLVEHVKRLEESK